MRRLYSLLPRECLNFVPGFWCNRSIGSGNLQKDGGDIPASTTVDYSYIIPHKGMSKSV